jgi:hypothetical protein
VLKNKVVSLVAFYLVNFVKSFGRIFHCVASTDVRVINTNPAYTQSRI